MRYLINHTRAAIGRKIKGKRLFFVIACLFVSLVLLQALTTPNKLSPTEEVITDVKSKCVWFNSSCNDLRVAIDHIKIGNNASVKNARQGLLNCRLQYKSIAFFLEYYFKSSAGDFNAPPKFDPEEPEDDYREPVGLQQIEALLFKPDASTQKEQLQQLAGLVCKASHNLPAIFSGFTTSDAQMMRCLQITLVSVMTLDVEGYDAPLLKSGITEARVEIAAVQTALGPFFDRQPSAKLDDLLSATLAYLVKHPDFDHFNRMEFLTRYAMPLQQGLNEYVSQAGLAIKSTGILNTSAKNVFSPDALNKDVFLDFPAKNKQLVALGKALFFDKRLSGPATRSCATCHKPENYFTDGLATSKTINGRGHVLRNAPTLLYSGFQYTQFWDARAKSMVEQVHEVLNNKQEMAGNDSVIIARLKRDRKYINLFKSAFPRTVYQHVNMYGIAEGLTAYVLSLSPRNSAFDRYIMGNHSALSSTQIKGFNLFMGKAKCGTCHFAPLFNGLIPPFYETTELEIIGVPRTYNRKKLTTDNDEGAYRQLQVNYLKGAFKTPTVRNVAKTGPYMHNGSFHSLTKVLDFYNAGGGNGWGLNNREQTLSADSLKLSSTETTAIISFLNSLTDRPHF